MRIGLALGAGGVVGASWILGALEALEAQTGFRAGDADEVLGTSSGSVIAALVAARVSTAAMTRYASGEDHDIGELAAHDGTALRLARIPLPLGPGSMRMVLSARRPAAALTGLLPRGVVRTDPIRELVERAVGSDWPASGGLQIVACDYATGQRICFDGGGEHAGVSPGLAVAASCAIPAFYAPVQIGRRRYVDGGLHSHSNLDLFAYSQLDAVICLNPMSSSAWVSGGGLRDRLVAARRRRSAALLAHEADLLGRAGTKVVVLEPAFADLAAMGSNMMARDRGGEVIAAARASTERTLRRLGRRRLAMVGLSVA
jgi:NTE family protein